MKLNINLLLVFSSFAFLIIACDRPACNNTNPIFDKFSPESSEYKDELVKQLEISDPSKLTYWFNQYVENKGQEQVFFNVQGDGLCAVIVLNVKEWGKMEEVRQKKGASFRGAKFTNLSYDIRQDSAGTEFIYRDYDKIVD